MLAQLCSWRPQLLTLQVRFMADDARTPWVNTPSCLERAETRFYLQGLVESLYFHGWSDKTELCVTLSLTISTCKAWETLWALCYSNSDKAVCLPTMHYSINVHSPVHGRKSFCIRIQGFYFSSDSLQTMRKIYQQTSATTSAFDILLFHRKLQPLSEKACRFCVKYTVDTSNKKSILENKNKQNIFFILFLYLSPSNPSQAVKWCITSGYWTRIQLLF